MNEQLLPIDETLEEEVECTDPFFDGSEHNKTLTFRYDYQRMYSREHE